MKHTLISVLLIVTLAVASVFFKLRIDRAQENDDRYSLTPPLPYMKYYAFGFNESVADSLWLRYIQDMEKCQLYGTNNQQKTVCNKGWSFLMLDQITDLAPKFRMPYAIGALSLSVLTDDYDGAGILFEKAVRAFPDDWKIQYKAAYYYLFDKNDPLKAAKLLLQAQKNGGPEWLALLASRLYDRSGQLALGISTLKSYLNVIHDAKIKARVEKNLARLMCEQLAIERGKPIDSCPRESQQ